MSFHVHPKGICESINVGDGTRIWAFAHVLPGARIGTDCNICDHVFVENDVIIGDRVTIKCGVQLWDGVSIGDDVFIGSNATFTNDKFPRSKHHLETALRTIVEPEASIGANSTILPGLRIGRAAMIGAGAVVTRDVTPRAIVVGNPGHIVGYVDAQRRQDPVQERKGISPEYAAPIATLVRGVSLHRLRFVRDLRGSLSAGEMPDDIPFMPCRYFTVFDVPNQRVRGEHAHRSCEQFLVCLRGFVTVLVDDGESREELVLDRPDLGIYLPPRIWSAQYKYSSD